MYLKTIEHCVIVSARNDAIKDEMFEGVPRLEVESMSPHQQLWLAESRLSPEGVEKYAAFKPWSL